MRTQNNADSSKHAGRAALGLLVQATALSRHRSDDAVQDIGRLECACRWAGEEKADFARIYRSFLEVRVAPALRAAERLMRTASPERVFETLRSGRALFSAEASRGSTAARGWLLPVPLHQFVGQESAAGDLLGALRNRGQPRKRVSSMRLTREECALQLEMKNERSRSKCPESAPERAVGYKEIKSSRC